MTPEPPFTPRAETFYADIVAALEADGRMQPSLMPVCVRYANALDLAWRAWEELPKETLIGRTDRGGDRVHPAVQAVIAAEDAASRWGQALGLEPRRHRAQTGRPLAAVSAPDRTVKLTPLRRLN
jgi:phage terminase small subunit